MFSEFVKNGENKLRRIKIVLLASSKDVSVTALDTINAVYRDKPLIFIGATFGKKLISHHWAVDEADSCLLCEV